MLILSFVHKTRHFAESSLIIINNFIVHFKQAQPERTIFTSRCISVHCLSWSIVHTEFVNLSLNYKITLCTYTYTKTYRIDIMYTDICTKIEQHKAVQYRFLLYLLTRFLVFLLYSRPHWKASIRVMYVYYILFVFFLLQIWDIKWSIFYNFK